MIPGITRPRTAWVAWALGATALWLGLVLAGDTMSGASQAWSIAIVVAAPMLGILVSWVGGARSWFAPLMLISLAYWVYFGFRSIVVFIYGEQVISGPAMIGRDPFDGVYEVAMVLVVGMVAMSAGYLLPVGRGLLAFVPDVADRWDTVRTRQMAWLVLAIALLFNTMVVAPGLYSFLNSLLGDWSVNLGYTVQQLVAILLIARWTGLWSGPGNILFLMGTLLYFVPVYFLFGFKADLVWFLLSYLICREGVRRDVSARTLLAAAALCAFVIFPAITVYRSLVWFDPEFLAGKMTLTEMAERYLEVPQHLDDVGVLLPQRLEPELRAEITWLDRLQRWVLDLGQRFIGYDSLLLVVTTTPRVVPYLGGYSIANVFLQFIPRAIWKDKPAIYLSKDFAILYWGTPEETFSVNPFNYMAITNIAELYANGGIWWVLLGMAALGISYRTLAEWLQRNSNRSGLLIYIFVLVALGGIEQNIALPFGRVAKQVILTSMIVRGLNGAGRRLSKRHEAPGQPGSSVEATVATGPAG